MGIKIENAKYKARKIKIPEVLYWEKSNEK